MEILQEEMEEEMVSQAVDAISRSNLLPAVGSRQDLADLVKEYVMYRGGFRGARAACAPPIFCIYIYIFFFYIFILHLPAKPRAYFGSLHTDSDVPQMD